jgi:hypothetical protein
MIITTISNNKIDLTNIDCGSINIGDIAHSLSMTARFNGHTKEFYSVGLHCLNCYAYGLRHWQEYCSEDQKIDFLAALLLHDASEAYIGDIPTPIKLNTLLNINGKQVPVKEIENKLLECIFNICQFDFNMMNKTHEIDKILLKTEMYYLTNRMGENVYQIKDAPWFQCSSVSCNAIKEEYLRIYNKLREQKCAL